MNINEIVGQNIRKYRKMKKLSQKELGELVGVKHNTISHYEKGRNAPERNMIFAIARALGVRADDLFPETTTDTDDTLLKAIHLEDSDLDESQREFLRELIDKALSLNSKEREDFIENIRFAVEYFDRKKK